jgi:signal transduction histidine kinase
MYGFQSYISMPIVLPNGQFFGTLCAIDPRPNRLDRPEIVGMFNVFAELIAFQLHALEKVEASEASLAAERETAMLREQFIAVLAHDLRNPLASIDAGSRLIARTPINEKAAGLLVHMQRSVVRMTGLINNVMDFARGRLGGGMGLNRDEGVPLDTVLEQVLAETCAVWPERRIEAEITLREAVFCDHVRIGQLFSNLLGNAMTHGAEDVPVRVKASSVDGVFELTVSNGGDPIPEAARARLFQPFFRGDVKPNQEGLGLGLYIANEIARAHQGTLDVTSAAGETRFTLRMPSAGA